MNKQLVTFSIQFKREENSEWEEGIYVRNRD
jgi:hypothetical protein